jgi:hypothetical protein
LNSRNFLFLIIFLLIGCFYAPTFIPEPNPAMANKIQFNPESKEIWAFDLEGQEHYFAKPLDYYIDILNSPNDSLNSFSITSYCKYHRSSEIVVIDEKQVSVLQTFTISKLSDKKRNNYRESGTGDETIIPGARLEATDRTGSSSYSGTSSGGNSGGSGSGSNITIDKKK